MGDLAQLAGSHCCGTFGHCPWGCTARTLVLVAGDTKSPLPFISDPSMCPWHEWGCQDAAVTNPTVPPGTQHWIGSAHSDTPMAAPPYPPPPPPPPHAPPLGTEERWGSDAALPRAPLGRGGPRSQTGRGSGRNPRCGRPVAHAPPGRECAEAAPGAPSFPLTFTSRRFPPPIPPATQPSPGCTVGVSRRPSPDPHGRGWERGAAQPGIGPGNARFRRNHRVPPPPPLPVQRSSVRGEAEPEAAERGERAAPRTDPPPNTAVRFGGCGMGGPHRFLPAWPRQEDAGLGRLLLLLRARKRLSRVGGTHEFPRPPPTLQTPAAPKGFPT